ncbi:MAG: hypothetical protein AABZ02_11885 [Bacteroidota bacterium]
MSQKTESSEFAPAFLWQVCVLSIIALSVMISSERVLFKHTPHYVEDPRTVLFPWVIAGMHTLENGLNAFAGKPARFPEAVVQARVLAAVLIGFVVCPGAFLLEWRRRRLNRDGAGGRSQLRGSSLLYGFSGVIALFVAASIIPISVISETSRQHVRQGLAVQDNRDLIINDIHFLALNIYQYRLLPRDLGGGNGSYRGYRLPEEMSRTNDATYSVSVTDHAVTIHAQSLLYPTASVEVKVDTTRRLAWWKFAGEFQ